jgi:hypothetical protein
MDYTSFLVKKNVSSPRYQAALQMYITSCEAPDTVDPSRTWPYHPVNRNSQMHYSY